MPLKKLKFRHLQVMIWEDLRTDLKKDSHPDTLRGKNSGKKKMKSQLKLKINKKKMVCFKKLLLNNFYLKNNYLTVIYLFELF